MNDLSKLLTPKTSLPYLMFPYFKLWDEVFIQYQVREGKETKQENPYHKTGIAVVLMMIRLMKKKSPDFHADKNMKILMHMVINANADENVYVNEFSEFCPDKIRKLFFVFVMMNCLLAVHTFTGHKTCAR